MSRPAPTCAIVGGGLGGLVTYTTLRHGGLDSSVAQRDVADEPGQAGPDDGDVHFTEPASRPCTK